VSAHRSIFDERRTGRSGPVDSIVAGGLRLDIGGGQGARVARQRTPVVVPPAPVASQHFVTISALELPGREDQVEAAMRAVGRWHPLGVHAPPGFGKSSLLRQLAGLLASGQPPGAVVRLRVGDTRVEDLLQRVFQAIYRPTELVRPSGEELVRLLGRAESVVLLDDVTLGSEQLDELLEALSSCAVVLAAERPITSEQCTWLELPGLDDDAALDLVTLELGEVPLEDQHEAIARLSRAVGGQPLALRLASAFVREIGLSFGELAEQAAIDPILLERLSVQPLGAAERRALAVLALAPGAPLPIDLVSAMTGATADRPLATLDRSGIADRENDRYAMTACNADDRRSLLEHLDVGTAIRGLSGWLERRPLASQKARAAVPAALAAIVLGAEHGDWPAVVRLVGGIEPILALAGRWEAWRDVLDQGLEASRLAGDGFAEADFSHQLGCLEMCVGNLDRARHLLEAALRKRSALGDRRAVEVSSANLRLIAPDHPPVAQEQQQVAQPSASRPRGLFKRRGERPTTPQPTLGTRPAPQPTKPGGIPPPAPFAPQGVAAQPQPDRAAAPRPVAAPASGQPQPAAAGASQQQPATSGAPQTPAGGAPQQQPATSGPSQPAAPQQQPPISRAPQTPEGEPSRQPASAQKGREAGAAGSQPVAAGPRPGAGARPAAAAPQPVAAKPRGEEPATSGQASSAPRPQPASAAPPAVGAQPPQAVPGAAGAGQQQGRTMAPDARPQGPAPSHPKGSEPAARRDKAEPADPRAATPDRTAAPAKAAPETPATAEPATSASSAEAGAPAAPRPAASAPAAQRPKPASDGAADTAEPAAADGQRPKPEANPALPAAAASAEAQPGAEAGATGAAPDDPQRPRPDAAPPPVATKPAAKAPAEPTRGTAPANSQASGRSEATAAAPAAPTTQPQAVEVAASVAAGMKTAPDAERLPPPATTEPPAATEATPPADAKPDAKAPARPAGPTTAAAGTAPPAANRSAGTSPDTKAPATTADQAAEPTPGAKAPAEPPATNTQPGDKPDAKAAAERPGTSTESGDKPEAKAPAAAVTAPATGGTRPEARPATAASRAEGTAGGVGETAASNGRKGTPAAAPGQGGPRAPERAAADARGRRSEQGAEPPATHPAKAGTAAATSSTKAGDKQPAERAAAGAPRDRAADRMAAAEAIVAPEAEAARPSADWSASGIYANPAIWAAAEDSADEPSVAAQPGARRRLEPRVRGILAIVAGVLLSVLLVAVIASTNPPGKARDEASGDGQVSPATKTPATTLGRAAAPKEWTLEPVAADFGQQLVGTSGDARTLVIRNGSGRTGKITAISIEGNQSQFEVDTRCAGVQLAPGFRCRINVRFAPTALGEQRARVRVSFDGKPTQASTVLLGTSTQ
jgi:ASPM-SPD-2-Hydin domain-containing protein